jgi:hypothetical protein
MPHSMAKNALNNKADNNIRLRPSTSPIVPQMYPPNIIPKNVIELRTPLSDFKQFIFSSNETFLQPIKNNLPMTFSIHIEQLAIQMKHIIFQ